MVKFFPDNGIELMSTIKDQNNTLYGARNASLKMTMQPMPVLFLHVNQMTSNVPTDVYM